MEFEEFINILKNNKFIIYGAGYVAEKFYKGIKIRSLEDNLECFVTTEGDTKSIDNYPIKSIDNIKISDYVVCLAVHESLKEEINKVLLKERCDKCIWIYPFLYEFMLGTPIKKNIKIPVKQIYLANKDNLLIATRYVVLEQFYGLRNDGDDIYMACMELYCSHETAKKRLINFKDLIRSIETRGFLNNYPISILDNYKHIDGVHRLSMAIYKKVSLVNVNIYPSTMRQEEIHGLGGLIHESELENKISRQNLLTLLQVNAKIESSFEEIF
ncbi:hypothetical protein SAMN04487830_12149 [Pseudobutyrivibrio sp. OR37]|uniref:hypothetical protein n=1 Tax=Pseudobutyrivibrio sp. OR37 TaxID=1798186 RepID=UPI0008E537B6|nr:hypothetical protein [Pseudobutyrivibrio sp. OR37]SFI08618.1 hypothetical protein SAMN04487830_12149 [Pseudobutyrivibrio sp. OR37]